MLQNSYYYRMESKNARFLRESVLDRCRSMTPNQRLRRFIEHSRLMRKLRAKGETDRMSQAPEDKAHG